jgi:hypothetical protein
VHLYLDPSTFLSEAPILYADCEGLDGGERLPLATTSRQRRGLLSWSKEAMMIRPFSRLDIIPSMNFSGQRLKKNEQDIMRFRGSTHVFYSHFQTLSYSCIETKGMLYGCNSNHNS